MKKVVLFSLFILVLSSCQVQPKEEELPTVRYVNFRVYDPVYVAIDKGFFEKRGINVEIIGDVLAGPNAIQAVSGGSAEAGLSSVPAIINANSAGLPVQGVVDVQTTLQGQSLQNWYVRSDSPLNSLQDLCKQDEKPVYAVNIWRSSFHYTSLLAFEKHGISEDCVEWVLLPFTEQITALQQENVDVIGLIEPYQTFLENEQGDSVRMLYNDFDDVYGEKHVSLIFVNRIWARENTETATAFASGISDAINWIEDNQAEASVIISKYTGIPESSVRAYHFTDNGKVRMVDVEFWLKRLQETEGVPDWLNLDDIATNAYTGK